MPQFVHVELRSIDHHVRQLRIGSISRAFVLQDFRAPEKFAPQRMRAARLAVRAASSLPALRINEDDGCSCRKCRSSPGSFSTATPRAHPPAARRAQKSPSPARAPAMQLRKKWESGNRQMSTQ